MELFKKDEPQSIEIKGYELICPVCSNKLFWSRSAQLNTAIATFFNFDWTNKSATCTASSECTHISWFLE